VIVATAALSLVLFVAALAWLDLIAASASAVVTAREAAAIMGDRTLDDRAREHAVQQASLRLFSGFASILGRGVLALAVSALPLWLAHVTGLADVHAVLAFLARPDIIAIVSAIMIGGYLFRKRLWTSN